MDSGLAAARRPGMTLGLHQLPWRPRTFADAIHRHDGAVLRIGFVVLLDLVDIVEIIHHQAVRLRNPFAREIAERIELLEPRAIAEMEACDRIERAAGAA